MREPYPSLFKYPHQIPTHHTVDKLPVDELQELDKRIEAKAKLEKRKKGKAKKKTKPETSEKGESQLQIPVVEPQEVDRNIQPETPPQTPTMPRGDRRNDRNNDDDGGQNGSLLEIFPNLREKVNNHIHTSWNLRITW